MKKPSYDLKALRNKYSLTQDELACKLGYSRSNIATLETGRQGLSHRMMREIIDNFDVDYEDFYRREESG